MGDYLKNMNGHQDWIFDDHHFIVVNVSINNAPVFVSALVIYEKGRDSRLY